MNKAIIKIKGRVINSLPILNLKPSMMALFSPFNAVFLWQSHQK
jgi:hypothetical protein